MKKIIIPCTIVIIAVLAGLIFYNYNNNTIFDISKVIEIDAQFTKYKSFTDTQSIATFIKALNSSKPVDKVDKHAKSYTAYKVIIHNKDGNITRVQLLLSPENDGQWIITENDGTKISKIYIIPFEQANKLYDILKDS